MTLDDEDALVDEYNELVDVVITMRLTQAIHGTNPNRLYRTAMMLYFRKKSDRVRKACRALMDAGDIGLSLNALESKLLETLNTLP